MYKVKNIVEGCMDGSAKPQKVGVEMVVCRKDRAHKHYTNNPIPTSFLYATSFLDYILRDYWEITLSV